MTTGRPAGTGYPWSRPWAARVHRPAASSPPLDLAVLAGVAEIVGVAMVAGGGIFAALQIRDFRRQRRDSEAITLLATFQREDAVEALWFQWLVERMAEDPARGKSSGAHLAFRDGRG